MNNKPTYEELERQVAELKKQNEALKLSKCIEEIGNARYCKTIANIGDVIVIINGEGLIEYNSPNIEKYFGWKPEDVIGNTAVENIYAEDLDVAQKFIETLIDEPDVEKTTEIRYKCKDGRYKWIGFTCRNLMHEPDINGLLGNYRNITERKQAEIEKEKLLHKLGERVKELNCLYNVAKINEIPKINLEHIFEATVRVLPPAWQYPEITCARIIVKTREYKTDNFIETKWKQSVDISIQGEIAGEISIYYLEERPPLDEGPFLKEERTLLQAIAERLGRIYERKQIETDLKVSEKYLDSILNNMGDPVFVKDEQHRFLLVNEAFCKLFELSRSEIIGQTLSEDVSPEEQKAFLKIDEQVFANGLETINEETLTIRGGQTRIISTRKTRFIDNNGEKFLIGVIRDITKRKQAETALRMSEEKYRNIFENVQDVFYETTLDGVIIEVSPSIETISKGQYTRADLIGKSMYNFYPDIARRDAVINELQNKGSIYNLELTLKNKDGFLIPCSISSKIFRDVQGHSQKIIGSLRDITEQKKAELEIIKTKGIAEESERKLKTAIFASPFPIMIHADDGEVIIINEAWSELTGYSLKDIPTIYDWSEKAYRQKSENIKDYIDKLYLPDKKIDEREYEIYTARGNKMVWDFSSAPLGKFSDGRRLIISIAKDITEKKLADLQMIKAKEKAEESDRLKSAFLANMSHEIRTPMNGILGFAELLKEPNLTGVEQQKYINIIEKSGSRMLNIINDIVSISKIESGQMEVNIQESNINEQIEYIYTFFKPEVEAKGIQLLFKNPLPSNEAILKTDREKVYAILTNLVKNAVKYTKTGSIEFGYKKRDNFIEFYVKDTGIGIPKDRQEAIFERFIQADITDKNATQGAGLGLSISKAYVEMLGGKIWVESGLENRSSAKAGGSAFYFTLPYQHQTMKENPPENDFSFPADTSSVNKFKVLIVDDDETSVELLSITAQKFGKEIIVARTGTEAVAACLNNPDMDLVLMDIQMPVMNGYDATREIRKFNNKVIIIAQTAFALEGDREKALAAGCDDYIAKPIDADELTQKIIAHLN